MSGHDGAGAGDDFLSRERAALGDDAAQFASVDDNAATVEDGEDDLLGGGGSYGGGHAGGEEITEFESSFPAMDTRNQVSLSVGRFIQTSNSRLMDLFRISVLGAQSPAQAFLFNQLNLSHHTVDLEHQQKKRQSLYGKLILCRVEFLARTVRLRSA